VNLVESSIWLLIASMLATLEISKAMDDEGKEIEPELKFENAVFRWVLLVFSLLNGFIVDIGYDVGCRMRSNATYDRDRPRRRG
jgi:hypothetical protein